MMRSQFARRVVARRSRSAHTNAMPRLEAMRESLLQQRTNINHENMHKTTKTERHNFFIETRGCQMNVSDGEVMRSILLEAGHSETVYDQEASAVIVNTCAIRDKAEAKVWNRLRDLRKKNNNSMIVVTGCMAERVKSELLDTGLADAVLGPDAYRDLPQILDAGGGMNTQLSLEETYADIAPVRRDQNSPNGAFISIQRGCSNMCSFCIVPFVRGRDRSRPVESILTECRHLYEEQGVREITLLGQNVNSYAHYGYGEEIGRRRQYSTGFEEPFVRSFKRDNDESACRFADLLVMVAEAAPGARIRFTSPHPKDFPDILLDAIAETPNVAKQLHLPAQSGSTSVLTRMRRAYTIEAYRALVERARTKIPGVGLSSDFITGFCGETEEDHRGTWELIRDVQYDQAFLYAYSMRPGTHAHRRLEDDVPLEEKKRRLAELNQVYYQGRRSKAEEAIGDEQVVLVQGPSARNPTEEDFVGASQISTYVSGRNDANRSVIFNAELNDGQTLKPGDFALVQIQGTNGHALFGKAVNLFSFV
mmetsp:Transcript_8450/g.12914  ORF Transcript_8450/g.12914 Transcript_8450/m.12914 type:complete len:536 (-) Transcript_8450:251-1858(-)